MPIGRIKKAVGAYKKARKAGTMKRAAKAKGIADEARKGYEKGHVWGATKVRGLSKKAAAKEAKSVTGSRAYRQGQVKGLRARKKVRVGAAVAAGGAGAYALSRRKKRRK